METIEALITFDDQRFVPLDKIPEMNEAQIDYLMGRYKAEKGFFDPHQGDFVVILYL